MWWSYDKKVVYLHRSHLCIALERTVQDGGNKHIAIINQHIAYMGNADFWASVNSIISGGFTPEGLQKLDYYVAKFISGRLVYQRFSSQEQHGCSTGGYANVVASLLAGAKAGADSTDTPALSNYEKECQRGAQQESAIEKWAATVGLWTDDVDTKLPHFLGERIAEGGEAVVYDHGSTLIKSIGLDYFIQPIFALDRIALHNAYFPETRLTVLGFGRDGNGDFKIIVEQPFIDGLPVDDVEIAHYMFQMGFELKNPRNWTYATSEIYLSDMHDENVIRSLAGTIFVVDCDIRINTPELGQGGTRQLTTDVSFWEEKET